MSSILSIDQSLTKTGITIIEDGELVHCQVIRTKKEDGDIFKRINLIVDELTQLIDQHQPDHIALESIPMGRMKGNSRIDLAGLFHVIVFNFKSHDVHVMDISTVKAVATGNGRADKDLMWKALPEHVEQFISSVEKRKTGGMFDICDSYWIGKTLEKQLNL